MHITVTIEAGKPWKGKAPRTVRIWKYNANSSDMQLIITGGSTAILDREATISLIQALAVTMPRRGK